MIVRGGGWFYKGVIVWGWLIVQREVVVGEGGGFKSHPLTNHLTKPTKKSPWAEFL